MRIQYQIIVKWVKYLLLHVTILGVLFANVCISRYYILYSIRYIVKYYENSTIEICDKHNNTITERSKRSIETILIKI